jgi:hypothetical protein
MTQDSGKGLFVVSIVVSLVAGASVVYGMVLGSPVVMFGGVLFLAGGGVLLISVLRRRSLQL